LTSSAVKRIGRVQIGLDDAAVQLHHDRRRRRGAAAADPAQAAQIGEQLAGHHPFRAGAQVKILVQATAVSFQQRPDRMLNRSRGNGGFDNN
jgi:hypothetical protein